ncbi:MULTISPECIES: thioredoxin family protein [Niastella]|uniref:Thioredoxin family protein n=1 Tax=Niastella soli TaxID=2821487 RepID=A0ABS3YUJ5_9BACT|nr:thioredoxin family protein [Niastella soli]MBO9201601.1 thioredoxin family protein [Niastella soli]
MKKLVLATAISLALHIVHAQETTWNHVPSWSAMLQKAKAEKKPIVIDCYFTGCHPCAQMDKEVFPNSLLSKEVADNFIGVKIDVFSEKMGDSITRKYAISGFPTFLVLDQNGNLVSMFGGYKDAGQFLTELQTAKQKISAKQLLTGISASYNDIYPDFYKQYYDRQSRNTDVTAANNWIRAQHDWTAEPVAMAIFRTGKLDADIETYFLKNYDRYRSLYGTLLVQNKATGLLTAQLNKKLNKTRDDAAFNQFLNENKKAFPADDWAVIEHVLAFNYFTNFAKDNVALLQFMNEHPVIYMNYYGAFCNNLLAKKEVTVANAQLLKGWADKAMNEETAFELLTTTAYVLRSAGDLDGFKKYVSLAIAKAKKYNVPADKYEKMLSAS